MGRWNAAAGPFSFRNHVTARALTAAKGCICLISPTDQP